MFKKFGQELPQSLVDVVSNIMEDKYEPAKPDADAVARKKKLDALRDKREADAADNGYEKEKPAVRKIAGKAYGGAKQKDEPEQHDEAYAKEELKGNQHKIDANKNGKVDADDFKILRGQKKVKEEVEELDERELSAGETAEKERIVKSMKKNVAGFKKRYGERAKSVMYATATKLAKEETEYDELVLDLTEGETKDLPFEPDAPHEPIAKAGKSGYGPSAARHLARMGLKKMLDKRKEKNETMMGKASCTSEETDGEKDSEKYKQAYQDARKKGSSVANARARAAGATDPKVFEESELEESRGHKIIATKLRQIDTMSSGIAPDHNTNNQSTRDKLKDASNVGKVEIVNQKDTTIKGADHTEDELETKRKLNQYSHGYGNVVHKEEVEQVDEISTPTLKNYRYKAIDKVIKHNRAAKIAAYDQEYDDAERHDKEAAKRQKGVNAASKRLAARGEIPSVKKEELQIDETATLDKYIKSMGYDPLNMDKNKKVMFSKTNAFKSWAQRQEALYDGGQKGTQDIDTHMSPGATARG